MRKLEQSRRRWFLVGAAGVEPATAGLEIRCSIRLSYAPTLVNSTVTPGRFSGQRVEGTWNDYPIWHGGG
jgi:hypothetical protein